MDCRLLSGGVPPPLLYGWLEGREGLGRRELEAQEVQTGVELAGFILLVLLYNAFSAPPECREMEFCPIQKLQ